MYFNYLKFTPKKNPILCIVSLALLPKPKPPTERCCRADSIATSSPLHHHHLLLLLLLHHLHFSLLHHSSLSLSHSHRDCCYQPWPLKQPKRQKKERFMPLCASYEVCGGYPAEQFNLKHGFYSNTQEEEEEEEEEEEGYPKLDAEQYESLLKGGEQVASVLQEIITPLEDMNMDEASEKVAVELAAQGVIGKRVDEMESGFMMALDYMIHLLNRTKMISYNNA